jgi:nitrogen regulatory protein P-II 1
MKGSSGQGWQAQTAILPQDGTSQYNSSISAIENLCFAEFEFYPYDASAAFSRTMTLMTKVEAIIQPSKFEAVKEVLTELGISGMTILEVRGHGRQKGHTEVYRGREYNVDLLPKIKIELVIPDNLVDSTVEAIIKTAATGKIGDGKIFLSRIDQAIRIRNQERGDAAL